MLPKNWEKSFYWIRINFFRRCPSISTSTYSESFNEDKFTNKDDLFYKTATKPDLYAPSHPGSIFLQDGKVKAFRGKEENAKLEIKRVCVNLKVTW